MVSLLPLVILITFQAHMTLAFSPVVQIDSGDDSNLEEKIKHLKERQALFEERMSGVNQLVQNAYNESKLIADRADAIDDMATEMDKTLIEISKLKINFKTLSTELKEAKESVKDTKPQDETQKNEQEQEQEQGCATKKGYVKVTDTICIRVTDKYKNYLDAIKFCKKEHAELITLYSKAEQDAVMKYIHSLGKDAYDYGYNKLFLYVGLHRKVEDDEDFKWIGNSTFPGIWEEKPSPTARYIHKCGMFVEGGLYANSCLKHFRFICRM